MLELLLYSSKCQRELIFLHFGNFQFCDVLGLTLQETILYDEHTPARRQTTYFSVGRLVIRQKDKSESK